MAPVSASSMTTAAFRFFSVAARGPHALDLFEDRFLGRCLDLAVDGQRDRYALWRQLACRHHAGEAESGGRPETDQRDQTEIVGGLCRSSLAAGIGEGNTVAGGDDEATDGSADR